MLRLQFSPHIEEAKRRCNTNAAVPFTCIGCSCIRYFDPDSYLLQRYDTLHWPALACSTQHPAALLSFCFVFFVPCLVGWRLESKIYPIDCGTATCTQQKSTAGSRVPSCHNANSFLDLSYLRSLLYTQGIGREIPFGHRIHVCTYFVDDNCSAQMGTKWGHPCLLGFCIH